MASAGTFAQVPALGLAPMGLWLPLVVTGKSHPVKCLGSLRAGPHLWERDPVLVHRCPLAHTPGCPIGFQHSPRLAWNLLQSRDSWLCLLLSGSLPDWPL